MPVPPEVLRRYVGKIRKLEVPFTNLEEESVRRLGELVRTVQSNITAKLIANPSDYTEWHLGELKRSVQENVDLFNRKWGSEFSKYLDSSHSEGEEFAAKMLAEAGIQFDTVVGMSPTLLTRLQGYSVDLITNTSEELKKRINNEITLGVLGQKQVYDVIQTIGANLTDPSIFRTFMNRAETIARTEMNRVYSLANFSSYRAAERALDTSLEKVWISTSDERTRRAHIAANGQIRPMDMPFRVAGEAINYPLDPAGSPGNTINCRCRIIVKPPAAWSMDRKVPEPVVRPQPTRPIGEERLGTRTANPLVHPSQYHSDIDKLVEVVKRTDWDAAARKKLPPGWRYEKDKLKVWDLGGRHGNPYAAYDSSTGEIVFGPQFQKITPESRGKVVARTLFRAATDVGDLEFGQVGFLKPYVDPATRGIWDKDPARFLRILRGEEKLAHDYGLRLPGMATIYRTTSEGFLNAITELYGSAVGDVVAGGVSSSNASVLGYMESRTAAMNVAFGQRLPNKYLTEISAVQKAVPAAQGPFVSTRKLSTDEIMTRANSILDEYRVELEDLGPKIAEMQAKADQYWREYSRLEFGSQERIAISAKHSEVSKELATMRDRVRAIEREATSRIHPLLYHEEADSITVWYEAAKPRKEGKEKMEAATRWIEKVIGKGRMRGSGTKIGFKAVSKRGDYNWGTVRLRNDDPMTDYVHEIGHHLEWKGNRIEEAVKFRESRRNGEPDRKLSQLTGNSRYKPYEVAFRDKWIREYMGKNYDNLPGMGPGSAKRVSEIYSMGMEYMYGHCLEFLQKDPEYFRFIVESFA